MSTLTLGISAYAVYATKPNTRYGQPAWFLAEASVSGGIFRMPLERVPDGATITSAKVVFYSHGDKTGTYQLGIYPNIQQWSSAVTWATRPDVDTTSEIRVTKVDPAKHSAWSFDVTATVQQIVAGTLPNYGFRLACPSGYDRVGVQGSAASSKPPVLIVTYTQLPPEPSNLHPTSAAIGIDKPVLSFDGADDMTGLQVQVDPAMNATAPGFDSGEVAATGGMLDLAATTYPGLAAGASTYWRARQRNAHGWSDWSAWAEVTRLAKPVVTIASPGATTDDGTPPITWTLAAGVVQTAWRVRLLNAVGDVVADSGRTAGADTAWAPKKWLSKDGQTGTIELQVWDDSDRVATPGDPEYVEVTSTTTLELDATVEPVDAIAAAPSYWRPEVTITGTRATVPDAVALYRDQGDGAEKVGQWNAVDVFDGTTFTLVDRTAKMNVPATYRVAPVVNGKTAKGGPTATVTPRCRGIWIANADYLDSGPVDAEETWVPIWTGEDQEQTQPETSIVHQPLPGAGEAVANPVRRRLVRAGAQGTITGQVIGIEGNTAITAVERAETLLRNWSENDAGQLYWLVLGNYCGTVILGDINFTEPYLNNESQRVLDVSLNWWASDE